MTKLKTRLLKDLSVKTTPITDDDYVVNTNNGTTKLKVKDITKNVENKVEILEDNISEVSEQLDNKANKNEIGTPLIASNLSEMIDKTKVYVNTTDGNWYSWNGSRWVIGGVYNSQGVGNNSISYEKLTHDIQTVVDCSIKGVVGENKVDLNRCIVGKYVSNTTGNLGVHANYSCSHFIEVFDKIPNFIDGTSGQNYAFYDSNFNFIIGGVVPYRQPIETPPNAKYIRFTFANSQSQWVMFTHRTEHISYVPYELSFDPNSIKDGSIPQEKINMAENSSIKVKIDNTLTRIAWKYDTEHDIWFDFDKVGLNGLYQIADMWLVDNSNKYVSENFEAVKNVFFTKTSDWIGPYSVSAKNNVLNQEGNGYTGGWHGYNGDQTGTATARNVSYKLYLDNNIISTNGVYSGNELKIVVVNRIQAKNTKLSNGNGREVLEEKVTYKVTKGKVAVDVKIKALEDINIYKYMGLQTCNKPTWDENMYFYDDSVNKTNMNVYKLKVESGTKSNGSKLSAFLMNKGNDYLYAWVDPTTGLGMRNKIDDWVKLAYCENYGKSYMNLIFGNSGLDMKQNEIITWNGGYEFYRE